MIKSMRKGKNPKNSKVNNIDKLAQMTARGFEAIEDQLSLLRRDMDLSATKANLEESEQRLLDAIRIGAIEKKR